MNVLRYIHRLITAPHVWLISIKAKTIPALGKMAVLYVVLSALSAGVISFPWVYQELPRRTAQLFEGTAVKNGTLSTPGDSAYVRRLGDNLDLLFVLAGKRGMEPAEADRSAYQEYHIVVGGSSGVDSLPEKGLHFAEDGLYRGSGEQLFSWQGSNLENFDFSAQSFRSLLFGRLFPALSVFFLLFMFNCMYLLTYTVLNGLFLLLSVFLFSRTSSRFTGRRDRFKLVLTAMPLLAIPLPVFALANAGWHLYGTFSMALAMVSLIRFFLFIGKIDNSRNNE
ncbi:MAG: hypothetical protein ACQEQV_07790 [Fibrobacterota bacterium]